MINGDVSFWWHQAGLPAPRSALPGDLDVDVAIVGAGYTGLWTAYYLKRAEPSLRIAVLERRFAGFGASGRNGGWLTNTITGGRERYLARWGRDAVSALQRAMNETVGEVMDVARARGIDADVLRGGEYSVALNDAQWARVRDTFVAEREWPGTDVELLDAHAAGNRIAFEGTRGAMWHPHAARIQPAKLLRGLADVIERMGVTIYEGTRVTEIVPGRAVTTLGTVRADFVVRATEGFTADFSRTHRDWLPMNSSLVVTEPLAPEVWERIGWAGREVVGDEAHSYFYAQRTPDDRIAIGGRGVPYRFASRTDNDGSTADRTVRQLRSLLTRLLPETADVPLAHAWSGVLGVPRDWLATVGLDRASGIAWAGGYVGTGVTATNLAGRTLRDLILGHDTELTVLPWVDHRVRRWEVEPIRWLAVRSLYAAYRWADRREDSGLTHTSRVATWADRLSGRSH